MGLALATNICCSTVDLLHTHTCPLGRTYNLRSPLINGTKLFGELYAGIHVDQAQEVCMNDKSDTSNLVLVFNSGLECCLIAFNQTNCICCNNVYVYNKEMKIQLLD